MPDQSATALRVKAFQRTCIACPSQWEGQLEDGRWFYARYRWSSFCFGVGATLQLALEDWHKREPDAADDEDHFGGFMGDSTMVERMRKHGFEIDIKNLATAPVEEDWLG
jgi:hypothetical protein